MTVCVWQLCRGCYLVTRSIVRDWQQIQSDIGPKWCLGLVVASWSRNCSTTNVWFRYSNLPVSGFSLAIIPEPSMEPSLEWYLDTSRNFKDLNSWISKNLSFPPLLWSFRTSSRNARATSVGIGTVIALPRHVGQQYRHQFYQRVRQCLCRQKQGLHSN